MTVKTTYRGRRRPIRTRELRALEAAVKAVGNRHALGRLVGLSSIAVGMWFMRGRVPAVHALRISDATGVPLRDLRPDMVTKNA